MNRQAGSSVSQKITYYFVLFMASILLGACGGGGDGGSQPGAGAPVPAPGIGPGGGKVASSDGKASVNIPAGALSQAVVITVDLVSTVPTGHFGSAYEFGPAGTTFSQPVTLSISYQETEIPPTLDEATLVLGKLVNNQWQKVPGSTVSTDNNFVSGNVTSFSTYGIIVAGSDGTGPGSGPGPNPGPSAPILSAEAGNGLVKLSWTPVDGAISYNLYRATETGVKKDTAGAVKTSTTTTSLTQTGLDNGTTYFFVVTGVDASGVEGVESGEVNAKPVPPGNATGTWVGNISGIFSGANQLTLELTQSGSDVTGTFKCSEYPGGGGTCHHASGPITGTVNGNSITMKVVFTDDPPKDPPLSCTLDGTISVDSMVGPDGSYKCSNSSVDFAGHWSATLQP